MTKDDIIRMAREAGFADGVAEIVGLEGFANYFADHADGACGTSECLPSFRRKTTPPAAQPEQEFDYKLAFGEWLDKTEWVQEKINSGHLGVRYLGMHRADVLRDLAYPNTVTGKAPQQRKWQGLTDDQIDEIAVIARRGNLHDLRIAIEAKLKERNNG
jgi:hypothetical protein